MSVDDLAAAALAEATNDPGSGRRLATEALRQARQVRARSAASVASRALGLALLGLRDVPGAVRALRAAVRYAALADDRQRVGEARMSLAAALGVRGRPANAIREIELALTDLTGQFAARAMVQRAAVLQDLGRYDEALADLRRALPVLHRAGDAQWEARARSNRSLMLIGRRAFRAADVDLKVAGRLCDENRLVLPGAYVLHNLGWLCSSRGDVVAALEYFRRAESAFAELGMRVGSLLADRAELLLSVRLLDEAREAAGAAIDAHRQQHRRLQVPEGQLLLSTIALVQGDLDTAGRSADAALRGFRQLKKVDGVALARFARLQAQVTADPVTVSPSRARRSAQELADAGLVVPALEARITAGLLALERGDRPTAQAELRSAARVRLAGPAQARVKGWYAEAQLRLADGRRRGAKSAIRAGLRVVDDYQSTLDATELRAHVSAHRDQLARLGLRLAIQDRVAAQVFDFVERTRASALRVRAVNAPDDPELSQALADLRTTVSEIEERRGDRRPTAELSRRQLHLERTIADRVRRMPAAHARTRRPVPVADVAAALGDAALVVYVETEAGLHAVTLVQGRLRLHELGPAVEIRRQTDHLAFALRRLAAGRTDEAGRRAALAMTNAIGQALDARLLAPVVDLVGDRGLVVVPAASMHSIAWGMLPSAVGRPVTVSPSAGLWWRSATRPAGDDPGGTVVAAGPTLAGAFDEATVVASIHPAATLLTGPQASAGAVRAAMDGADLVHIAAHGRLRGDNQLFSSLIMADGPLTVYELERLGRAPRHVVLAACEAGRSHLVTRDEVWGLAAALLGQGAGSLVAPVMSILDTATVDFMRDYHIELRTGRCPAEALALAQEKQLRQDPAGWAAGAPFVCLGDGLSAGRGGRDATAAPAPGLSSEADVSTPVAG